MKNLFKLSLITLLIFIASCARQKENNPKYAANLEVAKSFMLAHGTEDIAAQSAMIHDDLKWHMPVYGSEMADAQGLKDALAYYQKEFIIPPKSNQSPPPEILPSTNENAWYAVNLTDFPVSTWLAVQVP